MRALKDNRLPNVITDYELVWSDDFEVDGQINESNWGFDVGGHGWGNQELQYYTANQNASVIDGCLVIEARQESYEDREFTSARLTTKGKKDFLYGKIEVAAKVPDALGTWPAIWMLPTDWIYGNWPRCGEIDIMEHVGYNPGDILGTVHTEAYNHMINTHLGNHIKVNNVKDEFHKYSIEWLPHKIDFFVDDTLYFTFEPRQIESNIEVSHWPYDQPFHLILNLAVGGTLGGKHGVELNAFPQTLEIDYVRVYQSPTVNRVTKGE